METKRRMVLEDVLLTRRQRLGIWLRALRLAVVTPPPNTYSKTVEVTPDDPRWAGGYALSYTQIGQNFTDLIDDLPPD